jgi:uncharacterized OB-fold protein
MTATNPSARPLPVIGPDSAPFWEYARAGELRAQRCANCAALRLPPGPVCPQCWAQDHDWVPLSGRGLLHSWVVFHRQYHPAFPVPYSIGLVELEEGPRIEGRIVGAAVEDLRWRMCVELIWEEHDGIAVPAFRAAADSEEAS